MPSAAIYGCAGPVLTPDERRFFRDARPWGFILFGRNIVTPEQVRRLVGTLREAAGEVPVLIDQEGGRVARLGPPHWPARPAAAYFGALYRRHPEDAREAAYLNARLIACDLAALGITVDCLPVLDLPVPGADRVIGDRAFADDSATVTALGNAQINGLLDGGIMPVMKHIPGHGRAGVDSHFRLPRVDVTVEELSVRDFVPFRNLNTCPAAMTAHVVYESIDPQQPATTSRKVIRDVIRGAIGFDGLLMSDDLSMKALNGSLAARTRAALAAGCDLALHCNGDREEMEGVASEAGGVTAAAARRSAAALARCRDAAAAAAPFDPRAAQARLAALLEPVS